MPVTFRVGVGMAVVDAAWRVLAFERADHPGAWQLPQGGVEEAETTEVAMWRELEEETGLTATELEIAKVVPEWLGYELPEGFRNERTGRGQVHKWFVLTLRASATELLVDTSHAQELRSWRWMRADDLAAVTVEFRRPVYERLAATIAELERAP